MSMPATLSRAKVAALAHFNIATYSHFKPATDPQIVVRCLALTKIDWRVWCVQQTIGKRLPMLTVCPYLPVEVLRCGQSFVTRIRFLMCG